MKKTLLLLGAFALTSMAHAQSNQFTEGRITVDYWDKDEFNQVTMVRDVKSLKNFKEISKDIQMSSELILVKSDSLTTQRTNILTGEVKKTTFIQAREINCPTTIKLNIAEKAELHLNESLTQFYLQHPTAQKTYDAPVGSMSATKICMYTDNVSNDSLEIGQGHYEAILNYPNEIIKMQR